MTLIGRPQEIATMRSARADVVAGNGRVVMLSGEAGIGKTRLADEPL